MIRGLLTIGFMLFLATAAVWAYRNYGPTSSETRQAETEPAATAPQQNVPPPPVFPQPQPEVRPAPERAPVPAPQPVPETRPVSPAPPVQERIPDPPTPRVGKRTHLVNPGETLWEISRKYFNSPAYVEQIADANHLDAPNRLRPGMVLVLPEIPGLAAQESNNNAPARRTEEPEQVHATPQGITPMPPTLSRTVTVE